MKPKNTELQICSKLCILTSLFIVITVAEPLVSIPSRSIYNFKKIPENIFKEQGRERYSTHIQLDREIYRPGETLFWRSWIVNAFDNSPLPSSRSGSYTIEIVGPKGDVVSSEETYTCGTVDGDWVHLKYEDSGLYLSCEQSTIQLQEFKDDSTQLFRVNDNSFIECKAYPSMVVERNNNNEFMELMKENNRYIWPTTENGHRLTGDNLPFKPVTNTVGSRIRTTTHSSPVWVPYSESNWVILGRTWQIPSDLPGGNYILRIKFQDRYPVSERSFSVRSYRNPLVNFDTKFTQPGYGPSDTVVAVVKVKAADGSSLVGASLTITAQFNGDQIFSQEQQVQSYSNTISFPLPANFSTESSASITIAVNDPRLTDSSTVSVPLVLPGLLQLNFYPEGGPLVNNINNTVYFEALHSITNEPVSIEGILYENSEKILTPITTIHEGRGKFSLIPKLGAKYSVIVTKPTGTSTIFSLPEAIDNGAIIHSSSNIYGNTVDLELSLSGIAIENKGEFKVYLYKREEEIAMVTPNFVENTAKVQFTLSEKISGVLRVTLFHNNLPIAERLVFRENSKKLQIKIETIDEKKKYTPGSRVTLKLTTTDEHGVPVSAALGVSVTDETVIKMTEERKRAPRLPEMVQLENEVLNLTDSHVYLSDSPFAATAIDLLLGTQGWRRFVYKNPQKFINEYGDKAKKMLVYELVQRYHHMHRQMYKVRGFGFQPEMAMNMADAADLLLLDIEPMIGTSSEEDAAAPPEPSETIVTEDLNVIDKLNKEPLELDVYRVYAHQRKERKDSSSRFDFTQTVYWSTALLTSQTGSTEITFDLNDDITSFRVSVDGLVNDEFTYFGTQDLVINSVKNFYIQSKVPLEVTDGDTIRVPISLVNNAGHSVSVATKVSVLGEGLSLIGNPLLDNILPANEGVRQFVDVEVKFTNSSINPALSVSSIVTNNNDTWSSLFFPKDQVQPTEKDQLIRQITVKPAGFPVSIPVGGMLSSEKRFGTSITMPTDVVSNSLKTSIQLYVNPTANLLAAVEALLRQPYGCFEQASSTVYPLVLAQQYFKSHSDVPAELIIKAHYLLENGYKKLISYETSSNGFEWFGAAPGHDALSAYGLLEFTDMSTVFPVDPQLITRTSQWILSQKTADSFTRNSRALDTFGAAPEDVTLAYIVYALTSAGVQYNELEGQIKNLLEISKKSSDPYLLALIARSLLNVGNHDNDATRILEKLVTSQQPGGRVTGAKTSITSSMGTSLDIETTALSVLSWLSIDRFAASAQRSIEWLVSQCQDGKFGSTQSTILTLKAILAYDSVRSRVKEDGTVSIYVDNQLVSSVAFEANQTEPIKFSDLAHLFVANQTHSIELELSNGSPLPFSIQLDMNTLLPRSAPDSPVALTTKLLSDNLAEGQSTNVMVTVTNKRAESVGMVVAIIGLPGGLEARYEKLNELVASKTIDFYESKGREVVLYWRGMAANAEKELSIEVVAAVPGSYTGPASRAYLYYNDDLKEWNDPLRVTVNQNK